MTSYDISEFIADLTPEQLKEAQLAIDRVKLGNKLSRLIREIKEYEWVAARKTASELSSDCSILSSRE